MKYLLGVYNGDGPNPCDIREDDTIVYHTLPEAMEGLRLTVEEFAGSGFMAFLFHNSLEVLGDAAVRFTSEDDEFCAVYAEVTPVEDNAAAWGGIDRDCFDPATLTPPETGVPVDVLVLKRCGS